MSLGSRILLCCEHYPPSIGGVQEVMRQIAERLVRAGVDVTVATSTHPERAIDTIRNGVHVLSFPIKGNLVKGMTGSVQEYQTLLQEGNFDAILIKAAQQWTFDAAIDVLSSLKCRKLFIPCGFSSLSSNEYKEYYRQMPAWLDLFNHLIFYSNEYQDINFARRQGLKNFSIIPNGVDEREFIDLNDHAVRSRLGIDSSHDVLLSVGSQIAGKGHWEVVRAFGKARLNRSATLIINANTPGQGIARIKRHIKHALSGRWPLPLLAWWHGRQPDLKRVILIDLPREELVNLYKTADLFVLASHVEYSPLVLFEAAAAATPFLSTNVGNAKEISEWLGAGKIIVDNKSLCYSDTIKRLSNEMEVFLCNRTKLLKMGEFGRLKILTAGFTWEKIVERYRHLILTGDKTSDE